MTADGIRRLTDLQGSDPGVYVLAIHSFVEAFLRQGYDNHSAKDTFLDLILSFRRDLGIAWTEQSGALRLINDLAHAQRIANEVRHEFLALDPQEAVAATSRFLRFCTLAEVQEREALEGLRRSLELWGERRNRWQDMQELRRVGFELVRMRQDHKSLAAEVEDLRKAKEEQSRLAEELMKTEAELAAKRSRLEQKDKRNDELRRERSSLEMKARELAATIESLRAANEYVVGLTRMSLYTRSRLDYEREIVRLTPDQQAILDEITLGSDFLVRGGAGTGKTLVLLKALAKLLDPRTDPSKIAMPLPSFALVTYSDTLVKYDRYVASIIDIRERDERIVSADEYLGRKLTQIDPGARIDDAILAATIRRLGPPGALSEEEAAAEIEGFVFANEVTQREYCVDMIERSGMKRRLDASQRVGLWKLRDQAVSRMEAERVFSRNYSRSVIAQAARRDRTLASEDYLFIDEVQDLAPCDLAALKCLSRRAIIMAGDNDQAIFRRGFSFRRAGIDIVGRSRTINLNFRNTLQINDVAERFRKRLLREQEEGDPAGGRGRKAHERASQAFRPGPPPELYRGETDEELERLLVDRVKMLRDLFDYAPENLTVLVPDEGTAANVVGHLFAAGFEAALVHEPSFQFDASAGVRVTTLHSAKGIDMAVVLIFLPNLPPENPTFDPTFNDTLVRNLLYVCMTRAMEQLYAFVPFATDSAALKDVVAAFEGDVE